MNAPGKLWTLAVAIYAVEALTLVPFAFWAGWFAGLAVTECASEGRVLVCSSPWQMPMTALPMVAFIASVAVFWLYIFARRGRIRRVVIAAIATPAVQAVIVFGAVAAVRISGSAEAASG
ncbi:hypothetical protein [Rhodococcus sp. IEGM 1408]|uniref:hypothetical protein n=1 Tax=Rhodococcus sp. IEGM 1408 TaxID=3082220 RepID=UPI0029535F00|nr:hypothetical protein [Rhodococcus sp. IEGM 1408]MDV8002282.1 hypothetical protein [Rhodococcus sp. IEGM 1408]